ncbi:MAG: hypothetical protein HY908_28860 [Myxococcales bacterium]|nr:hypothetical protein [Myxococcales bacterium]
MANKLVSTPARRAASSGVVAGRPARRATDLAPGLHLARIEAIGADRYTVRTLDGRRFSAEREDSVEAALLEECVRASRPVLVCSGPHGPVVAGALQTAPSLGTSDGKHLRIEAADVKLRAGRSLTIEAGPVAIVVDAKGALRLRGDKMVIDMGSLLRILAARVELP